MPSPNLVLLYVKDPAASSRFYQALFDQAPAASFATYVAFAFGNGLSLGLWSTQAPDFINQGSGPRTELAFIVDSDAEVDALHQSWQSDGVVIELPPAHAVFGRTFVALDPDGHRIRVCTPDR